MNKKLKKIAALLPEGITEDTISQIALIIEKAVEAKAQSLNTKVVSYIRSQVDMLKEQAIKELELENPVFRDAQLFETVKSIMSIELMDEDEDNALQLMTRNQMQIEEENTVLTTEIGNTLDENTKLATVVKALTKKVGRLEEEKEVLTESKTELEGQVDSLNESNTKPFKSSEKALVASVNGGDPRDPGAKTIRSGPDLLSESAMNLMPFND